jgi:hypothetical protein
VDERVFDTRAVGGESLAEPLRPGHPGDGSRAAERADARARLVLVAERTRPVVLARTRTIPVLSPLAGLLPDGGLPRGITVAVGGPGATSVALALAAAPTATGSWVALVGLPGAGLAAAAELGVALERVAVIDAPEPNQWAPVVAALLGAFDLVLVGPGHRVPAGAVRRLAARARERGSVLMPVAGPAGRFTAGAWPEAPELRLGAVASRWDGLHRGHGHLRARRLTLEATGRRGLSQPRRVEVLLPGPRGGVEALDEVAAPLAPATPATATPTAAVAPAGLELRGVG